MARESKQLGYCDKCRKRVPYLTSSETANFTKHGIYFEWTKINPRCPVCNRPMYVPLINDENARRANMAYFEAKKRYEEDWEAIREAQ